MSCLVLGLSCLVIGFYPPHSMNLAHLAFGISEPLKKGARGGGVNDDARSCLLLSFSSNCVCVCVYLFVFCPLFFSFVFLLYRLLSFVIVFVFVFCLVLVLSCDFLSRRSELREYAHALGIDPELREYDSRLLWIARDLSLAPLPHGWDKRSLS